MTIRESYNKLKDSTSFLVYMLRHYRGMRRTQKTFDLSNLYDIEFFPKQYEKELK